MSPDAIAGNSTTATVPILRGASEFAARYTFLPNRTARRDGFLQDLVMDGRRFTAGRVRLSFRVQPVVLTTDGVSAPFTVTGSVSALSDDEHTVIATLDVIGRGTMGASFEPFGCCGGTTLVLRSISFAIGQ
jgi:hypothetical protein